MAQLTAIDALPIAVARRSAPDFQTEMATTAGKLWGAAFDLWCDEYQTYQALAALGHRSAAAAAWQRRTAAMQLSRILQQAF